MVINLKKLIILLMILALSLSIISCEKSHADNDGDGKCDDCGKTIESAPENPDNPDDPDTPPADDPQPTPLELIKDGKANFKIVYESALGGDFRKQIDGFVNNMKKEGITIVAEADNASEVTSCEILIGQVKNRGELYEYDMYSLGSEGYIIKYVGEKVLVVGGSSEALKEAIDVFIEDYIGYKKGKTIENLTVTPDNNIHKEQDEYRITSITVAGKDIHNLKIAYSGSDVYKEAAELLQNAIYVSFGYHPEIVSEVGDDENLIFISEVDDAGKEGFRVRVDGNLYVECAYNNALLKSLDDFITQNIKLAKGDVKFDDGFSYTKNVSTVKYADFGAKGDGETNDFDAIKAAHDYANESGQTVIAGYGTYYIGDTAGRYIDIRTNVDFTNAEFIIDDSNIPVSSKSRTANIFYVRPSVSDVKSFEAKSNTGTVPKALQAINANPDADGYVIREDSTPKLDLGIDYPALVIIYGNENAFIRVGGNANSGSQKRDVILIDADGNVDPSTPFMHDYKSIRAVRICRLDMDPLTITGGKFTTIANTAASEYNYYDRGIEVQRPFVTVKNLEHYITGEGDTGAPYTAFLSIIYTTDITVENCTFSAHKTYYTVGSGGGDPVGMGSYDLSIKESNNVVFKNCDQYNFFHFDSKGKPTSTVSITSYNGVRLWGIMGSNFCKNLAYIGSRLSRFDAHCGVYNARVIDSEITAMSIIGAGKLEITNTKFTTYMDKIVVLRGDYGSTWRGDIAISGLQVKTANSLKELYIVSGSYKNSYFGYTTYLPKNISIEGVKIENKAITSVYIFEGTIVTSGDVSQPTLPSGKENKNPQVQTESVTVTQNENDYTYELTKTPAEHLEDLTFTIVDP